MVLDEIKQGLKRRIDRISTDISERRRVNSEIQRTAQQAGMKERERQAIRVAVERERVSGQRQVQRIRSPGGFFGRFEGGASRVIRPVNVAFNPITGSVMSSKTDKVSIKRTKFVKVPGRNTFIKKTVKVKGQRPRRNESMFNPITGNGGGLRVI